MAGSSLKPVFFLPASQPMGPHGAVSAFSPSPGSPGLALTEVFPGTGSLQEAPRPSPLHQGSAVPHGSPRAFYAAEVPTERHGLTRNAYGMRARSSQHGWERGTARERAGAGSPHLREALICGKPSFAGSSHLRRYHIELGVAIAKMQGSRLISEKIMKSRLRSHFSHFSKLN